MIKTWQQRCEEHPDHEGIVSEGMIRARMQEEIDELRQVCRNIYEIWANSEGIPVAETCTEGYLLHLIKQMRDEAKAGLPDAPPLQQEPVGYAHVEDLKREHHDFWVNREQGINEVPLYTAPPKQWVGLTGEEARKFYEKYTDREELIYAIDEFLEEKNGG